MQTSLNWSAIHLVTIHILSDHAIHLVTMHIVSDHAIHLVTMHILDQPIQSKRRSADLNGPATQICCERFLDIVDGESQYLQLHIL